LQNVGIIEFHFSNQKGVPSRSFGDEVVVFKSPPSPCGLRRRSEGWWRRGESNPEKANNNKCFTVIYDDLR
jgi:hypothetical protein